MGNAPNPPPDGFPSPPRPQSRRYGEGETRPVKRTRESLFGWDIEEEHGSSYNEPSYEEWKLETMKTGLEDVPLNFSNPLCILSDDNEIIHVVVGKDATQWAIHRKLLCSQSNFFKTAIDSPFREGTENKVVLSEGQNDVFSLFVQWLYSGSFVTNSLPLLLQAYVLGDKLGSPGFQTLAFDKIYAFNISSCHLTAEQAVWASENTLPDSTLRRFTMDTMAFGLLNGSLNPSHEDWELLAPIQLDILRSVQSVAKKQEHNTWKQKPRLHYNKAI
ncbi:hypothetical protein VTN00DRAFT_7038 [Thermoascus crustaceus]|uniref:uncharacterized protein n=1 Tax=Thermoascus crustaceus TaxID=5088 RepID=UPI003743551D